MRHCVQDFRAAVRQKPVLPCLAQCPVAKLTQVNTGRHLLKVLCTRAVCIPVKLPVKHTAVQPVIRTAFKIDNHVKRFPGDFSNLFPANRAAGVRTGPADLTEAGGIPVIQMFCKTAQLYGGGIIEDHNTLSGKTARGQFL